MGPSAGMWRGQRRGSGIGAAGGSDPEIRRKPGARTLAQQLAPRGEAPAVERAPATRLDEPRDETPAVEGGLADALISSGVLRSVKDGTPTQAAPSIADVATAVVETRGAGTPADGALVARVGAAVGVEMPEVHVHGDDTAQAGSAAIGARAFAYGQDVFLGPGESARDEALMAHELTHVAQQVGRAPGPQRQVAVGAADSPAERHAEQVAGAVVAGAPPASLLVEDEAASPVEGQMRRTDFLREVEPVLIGAAREELGPFWSPAGCAILERYLREYARRPARDIEAFVRRFAPGTAAAATALAMIPALVRAGRPTAVGSSTP
jgi:hypothetical protein